MTAVNIKVEAMKVYYGEDTIQSEKVICHADTASTPLNDTYFKMYTPAGVMHVFWYNVATAGSAPTVPGATLHVIAVAALASAATVASATQVVVDAVAAFVSTVANNEVTITQVVTGFAQQGEDSVSAPTLFGIQTLVQGDLEAELGCMEGDIEVTFEETFAEVKCHDTGTTPIAVLKTGVSNVTAKMSSLETTKTQLEALFVKTNGSFTPEGGTKVFGMGTYKNFENMFKYATKLRLHPVRLLPGDLSEDWNFFKAIPKLTGVTFSGEKPFTVPLEFEVFPDESRNARVNYFAIGDGSQNLA